MTRVLSRTIGRNGSAVPRLQPGDRLTKAEFIRRYNAMPEGVKAELIRGVVYMPPIGHVSHGQPHFQVNTWLGVYVASTPGTDGGDNSSVHFPSRDSMPQPDCFLRILPECGGQTTLDNSGFLVGAPELVAEVAASSASYDLHDKLDLYRSDGVKEYLVWRTEDAAIDWFVLRRRRYEPLVRDAKGWLRSEVFPGLWLDAAALLKGDMARVLKVVHDGVSSPEHTAFVNRLSRRKRR